MPASSLAASFYKVKSDGSLAQHQSVVFKDAVNVRNSSLLELDTRLTATAIASRRKLTTMRILRHIGAHMCADTDVVDRDK
jgi:hypothetical protein